MWQQYVDEADKSIIVVLQINSVYCVSNIIEICSILRKGDVFWTTV